MKFHETLTVSAPADEVFRHWSDVEKYHEWADPVIERTKLTDGPIGVGTRFKCIDQWPGRKAEFEMEITEFDPEQRKLGAQWFKPMEGNWTSTISETEEGAFLEFDIEMKPPLIMRLLSPIMRRYAIKENAKFMNSFKQRVEAGTI